MRRYLPALFLATFVLSPLSLTGCTQLIDKLKNRSAESDEVEEALAAVTEEPSEDPPVVDTPAPPLDPGDPAAAAPLATAPEAAPAPDAAAAPAAKTTADAGPIVDASVPVLDAGIVLPDASSILPEAGIPTPVLPEAGAAGETDGGGLRKIPLPFLADAGAFRLVRDGGVLKLPQFPK